MLPKLVFSSFKLCLLVVICTAAPAADSDLSSGEDNEGNIVKLIGNEVLSGGANEEPINADDKDASVAEEPIDEEKNTDNGLQGDNPDANQEHINADEKDASVAEEPIDGEKNTDNEVQGYNPDANQERINADKKGTDEKESDDVENHSSENKITEVDQNDGSDIEHVTQNSTCYPGKNFVAYCNSHGLDLTPAEQIKFKVWPRGIIPYYIDELSYDKVLRDKIRFYLEEVRSKSRIRFEELLEPPPGDDERYVFFINRRGQLDCKDYNTNSFTIKGVQKVIIGYNCLEHGGPMAAVILALAGVPPQHNSPDRDRFISVMTDHILPEKKGLFRRLKDSDWLFHDLKYDFDSVSHYLSYKYTADGSETIKILDEDEREKRTSFLPSIAVSSVPYEPFGDRSWTYNNEKRTYSSQDLQKLRLLYNHIVLDLDLTGIKPEDCKALYRPGPSFSEMKLKQQKKMIAKKKPKKYLDAVGNKADGDKLFAGKGNNVQGEELSALE